VGLAPNKLFHWVKGGAELLLGVYNGVQPRRT
jgi:hypothetical protein